MIDSGLAIGFLFIGISTVLLYLYTTCIFTLGDVSCMRYLKARRWIHSYKQKYKKKFIYEHLKERKVSPVDIGLIPSPQEYEIENPHIGVLENCDGIHFSGFNFDDQYLDIYINKVRENVANVGVFLKLSNVEKYHLSLSGESRKPYIDKEYGFYSSGLQIKCLAPSRKWRISFNGLLQKCISDDKMEQIEMTHVKFSFIWHAMSVVQEHNIDFNSKELAKAFAKSSFNMSTKNLKSFYNVQNRYEQWGQLMGTVQLKGEVEKEMYLYSCRTRFLDSIPDAYFTATKLFMYFEDGSPVKIENLTIANLLSNYVSGYVIDSIGAAKSVTNCKFFSSLFHTNSSKATLSYKHVGLQKSKDVILSLDFLEDKDKFNIGYNLEVVVTIKPFRVTAKDGSHGIGIMYLMKKSQLNQIKDFTMPLMLFKDIGIEYPSETLLVSLKDDICKSSLLSGGKGKSLSLLTSLSEKTNLFKVPKGFIITPAALNQHLKVNSSINYAIKRVSNASSGKSLEDLKKECSRCTEEFQKSELSDYLRDLIQAMLICQYDNFESLRFSVRSSAVDEDIEDYSAAGQMLTLLGVHGLNNIHKAIIACWSSKFEFEAVQYARQNGIPIQSSMAVVVQEMVPSEVSGVLFTVDPVTGDPTFPHITANFGLGETVVSSLVDPDTIVLERKQDSLEVKAKLVGTKETQVHMKYRDGTEQNKDDSKINTCCLSDDLAIKIATAGLLVENCFCFPQDIEWALYKNKLFLLQARPIATLHTETEFELIHDQDTPVRSNKEFWTRANMGEVFSGATTPLTISLCIGAMDVCGLRNRFLHEFIPTKDFCPYFFHTLPITHKQALLNLIDVLFRVNAKEITSYQKAFEVSLFGREIGTKEMHNIGTKKFGYMSSFTQLVGFPLFIGMIYSVPKCVKDCENKIKNYNSPLHKFTNIDETYAGLLEQLQIISEVYTTHGMSTFLSSYYNLLLLTILSKKKKVWDNELYSDFSILLSTCSDVESADVPRSLRELANVMAKHYGSTFSSLSSNMAYETLHNDCGLPGALFKEFIRKHGHRCLKEFDVSSESWGMQPKNLMPILQNLVSLPNILNNEAKQEETIEAVISKLKTPLSTTYKKLLIIVIPWSQTAVRRREKTKSMLIKVIDWLRQIICHLGELFVQKGFLPSKEMIFFLTLHEIDQIVRGRQLGLVNKAIRRKKLHLKLDLLIFPEIINGIPKPIKEEEEGNCSKHSNIFTLKGTPVCQGKVKGTAKVIKSLEETCFIQNGDILITYSTDVGWTPYFPLLAGVVTVLGGLISHGAVVAREYGLPCIVGVKNAMSVFQSGDTIFLDGTNGTITKLANENDANKNAT